LNPSTCTEETLHDPESAPVFDPFNPPPDAGAEPRLEVIKGDRETFKEKFYGVSNPGHVLLVLPPADFDDLRNRVCFIRDKPVAFELVVDENDQLVGASIEGKQVHWTQHRSGAPEGLDYGVDDEGEDRAAG
jgi:hypothetical protein